MAVDMVVEAFCRAFQCGARVMWEERTIRGPAGALAGLREEPEATRAVMRRAQMFRSEFLKGGRELPGFKMPGVIPHHGCCHSCGEPQADGGRCATCVIAVYVALDLMPPRISGE